MSFTPSAETIPAPDQPNEPPDLEPLDDQSEDISLDLGFSDDYFSNPQGMFGFTNIEEIQMAIHDCKGMILDMEDNPKKKRQLVKKLVQLRIKREELMENPPPEVQSVNGHQFERRPLDGFSQQFCDKCCGLIWTSVLSGWYVCKGCGYQCHPKCVHFVNRVCPKSKIEKEASYILDICPEKGLSKQGFRCAECRKLLQPKDNPSQCDYNGFYYCDFCHWNSKAIIPARVIHNWDFEPRKVSRASYQLLRLLMSKPILDLKTLNPKLFTFVDELWALQRLRDDIQIMKTYFLSCQRALSSGLLLQLRPRQHFVEGSTFYSLADLWELEQGTLLPQIEAVRATFEAHITTQCQGCQGKGFICELCKADEIIFPFQAKTSSCPNCSSLFHLECASKSEDFCPRCERRAKAAKN